MKLRAAREAFLRAYSRERKDRKVPPLYSGVLADFISYVGNLDIERLDAQNIREYMGSLGDRNKKMALECYTIVRLWVGWCQTRGLVKNALSADEIEHLFQYISSRSMRNSHQPAACN